MIEVHRLTNSALLQLDLEPLAQRLLPINVLDGARGTLGGLVADEPVALTPPTRLVCHYSDAEDHAAILFAKEVEKI